MKASVLRSFVWVGVAAAFVLPALCQAPATGSGQPGANQSGHATPEPTPPYTAEYKNSNAHTFPDGRTVTEESTVLEALDSEGRHLTVNRRPPRRGETEEVSEYHLYDPVAWTNTYWSVPGLHEANEEKKLPSGSDWVPCPGSRKAADDETVVSVPRRTESVKQAPARVSRPATQPTEQDLGTRMFRGVEAHGTRTILSSGTVLEFWASSAKGMHGITVLSSDEFPHNKMVRELVTLTLGEPGLSFFQPPQDYEIVKTEERDSRCPSVSWYAQKAAQPTQ